MRKHTQLSVSEFLTQQITFSNKPQVEIAEECGYKKPNIISMIKKGDTKLPIDKIPAFAKSIGVDAVHLLGIAMNEYMPETWAVVKQLLGSNMITQDELKVLDIVRTVAGGQVDVCPETEEDARELAELATKWRERSEKRVDASMRRAEEEKRMKAEKASRAAAEKEARATGG